jgi:hypothetical protein
MLSEIDPRCVASEFPSLTFPLYRTEVLFALFVPGLAGYSSPRVNASEEDVPLTCEGAGMGKPIR